MMRKLAWVALLAVPVWLAAQPSTPQKKQEHKKSAPVNTGDRVFQANCSRCHSAPEQLSPRISGTVAMHMRVRANLSAEDQKLLLKYLAP